MIIYCLFVDLYILSVSTCLISLIIKQKVKSPFLCYNSKLSFWTVLGSVGNDGVI